ncbi:transcriptional regulator of RNA polII, SAGA, subunit-domain-containing protein [Dipodascopsis uninucleata]
MLAQPSRISASSSTSGMAAMNGTPPPHGSPQPQLKKMNSTLGLNNTMSSNATSNTGTVVQSSSNSNTTPSKPQRPARRIEVEPLMNEFRSVLGDKWDNYRDVITNFIIGKLSRVELQQELDYMLDKSMVRMHNQFLLASLANALRDPPPSTSGLPAWSKKSKDAPSRSSRNSGNAVVMRLKKEIMGFTPRERRRIKAITRDAGKKGFVPSTIILTRQAKLPKTPVVRDKEKLKANITQEIAQSYQAPLATESYELPDTESLRTRILGIAYEHGLLDGIANEVPDIILAGLEYHLRDFLQHILDRVRPKKHKSVSSGLISLAGASNLTELAELSGVTGHTIPSGPVTNSTGAAIPNDNIGENRPNSNSSNANVPNGNNNTKNSNNNVHRNSSVSLESSNRKEVTKTFEDENIITAEDMALALELAPHSIVESSGPLYRLYDVMLRDEIDDMNYSVNSRRT